ncbi:Iat4p NDAI_0I02840 [Naumovozyma dairenensis CBS 421]|uniref:N-acetyltransferase domain-containing protein n=1 Tax=Naumovozyma dairenensis (strain ATCC 10597 / BCRC 20456 / CBS 421 / NBRC 0211 / NRRL Y-12639) TaxID=1071378 RepID=G0WGE1_NAUDC|nr:hypothetical protein NDAI_0I02840 [Naumovozyma dairenensis CBS 421]CCD26852.1 hypothetical protein NDAI_0I02840 [Naumovozyma dairenensis CBS 421]
MAIPKTKTLIVPAPIIDAQSPFIQEGDDASSNTGIAGLNITNDVEKVAQTLCVAFTSPCSDYLMKKFFNIPLDEPTTRARVNAMIHYYTACYHDLGGELAEANDFDAVSLWSIPGKHLPVSYTNDDKFNKIFFDDMLKRKLSVLPVGMEYYYLFMIGKDLRHPEVRGSVRSIFKYYQKRADDDNCAIILEAISEHAKSVYEYFGFKNYLTFHFGKGECDSQGNLDPNGEGFTAYLMIYHKDGDKVLRA